MAKKMIQLSGQELVAKGNPKAVAELVRRHNNGSRFAIKRLEELGLDHEGNPLTDEQPAQDSNAERIAQLEAELAAAKAGGVPTGKPKAAKKTRKVKSVDAPPVFTEATLTAMPREQLKGLAGVGASSKLRSKTLVQQILGNQQPEVEPVSPIQDKAEYLKGMMVRQTLTDDGIMLEILGTGVQKKDGTYKKKAKKHDLTGACGIGNDYKEAVYSLNEGLAEQGFKIGKPGNWFEQVDERTGITKSNRPKRRNTNKSAVMTADLG